MDFVQFTGVPAMTRYTAEHKQQTRGRIIDAAGALIRERGLANASVDTIMEAAGLTPGSFYKHFASKEALIAETLPYSMERTRALLCQDMIATDGEAWLHEAAERYLSPTHRDTPRDSCPFAALLSELPRAGAPTRAAFTTGVQHVIAEVAPQLPAHPTLSPEDHALATIALFAGGIALARALQDPDLSDRVLRACRQLIAAHPTDD
jgi:TetR/AcrR family transcriptional repressor of nem operon